MATEDKTKSKTKKEIESISDRIKASRFSLKDAVVPLSVGLILIILGIFVFIPMLQTATSYRVELSEVREREQKLEKVYEQLNTLDEATLQIDLINAKQVIPQNLRVSSFISYIDTLANEKDLYSKSLTAGDSQVSVVTVQGDEDTERRMYYGVSSRLSYEGTLEDVSSFLDDLYTASPYVISTRGVSLRGAGDLWRVDINVTGYYVPEPSLEVDPYKSFDSYKNYQEVIDIFDQKASQLNN